MATLDAPGFDDATSGGSDDVVPVEIAGAGRRLTAGLVDWLAIAATTYLTFRVADALDVASPGWVAFIVAEFALVIAPIAVNGRPLGALLVGTVVIRSTDYVVPGWLTSFLRWLVAHVPFLVVGAAVDIGVPTEAGIGLAVLELVAWAVVYGGVLFHPSRQGLHDRVAETLVVLRHAHGEVPVVARSRRHPSDLRPAAAEERKRELVAMGASELMQFAQFEGFADCPPELASVIGGVELVVCTYRPLLDGSDDVLVVVTPTINSGLMNHVVEAFAIRDGSRIDELTDDEWAAIA